MPISSTQEKLAEWNKIRVPIIVIHINLYKVWNHIEIILELKWEMGVSLKQSFILAIMEPQLKLILIIRNKFRN